MSVGRASGHSWCVSAGSVVLLNAASIAEAIPGRWWVPPPAALAEVEAGRAHVKVLALELDQGGAADVWDAHAIWVDVEQRDAESVAGTIVESDLDGDGYREGDRLSVPLDRIFDTWLPGPDGSAAFNERRARFAIGKRVLVGVTVLSEDEAEVLERRAFAATLTTVEPGRGIELRLDDGTSYWLPPDAHALQEAPPGEYQLHGTGQTVVDPDYLTTWTITHSGFESFQPPRDGFAPPAADAEPPG